MRAPHETPFPQAARPETKSTEKTFSMEISKLDMPDHSTTKQASALAAKGGFEPRTHTGTGQPLAEMDLGRAQEAVTDLLLALGVDVDDEGVRGTPRRVAAAFAELLSPAPFRFTTFPNEEKYDELIVTSSLSFHSLCMHHLLPFHGVAHIGYLPGDRIVGLSKLGRILELFARGLQVQERLTQQVAEWLQNELKPKGVGVVIRAEHLCMSLRGVQKPGARTTTSALHGLIRDDARTRSEFLMASGLAG